MTAVLGWLHRFYRSEKKTENLALILAAGPISLFASLSAAFLKGGNLDLAIAAGAGIYLCFSYQTRGLFYALALLFAGALAKHFFFLESHLWQMGIEASVALGFVICALCAAQLHFREGAAQAKIESQAGALSNLEEEAARKGQEALEEKIVLQNRLADLQKELDDVQSELSMLRVLNEVVRKSSLKHEEADAFVAQQEKRIGELLGEIEALRSRTLPYEKEELLQELNTARVEREQTGLVNETLVRLHRAADRKARELTRQNELLEERIEALSQTQSEREEQARGELQEARRQMADLMEERGASLESERNEWKERLSERDRTIALFQERIRALSETQALYFQLKKQFEEKNQVLHETRQELFRAETALQVAQIEERWEEVEFPLFESLLASEVALLEEEKRSLESENDDLSAIIGILSKSSKAASAPAKKKSVRRRGF